MIDAIKISKWHIQGVIRPSGTTFNNWAMVKLTNINAIKGTQCFALNAIDKINDFFSDLFLIFPIFF